MPELPDITVYVEALSRRLLGQLLEGVRVRSPFLLRTFDPPLDARRGQDASARLRRLGKRIVFGLRRRPLHRAAPDDRRPAALEDAGRQASPGKVGLAAFDFADGTLLLTEAGHQAPGVAAPRPRRGRAARRTTPAGWRCSTARSTSSTPPCARENHTLKRALTDPRLFSGIGNAYSDEILHRAQLSPLAAHAEAADRGRPHGSTTRPRTC